MFKKTLATIAWTLLVAQTNVSMALNFWWDKVSDKIKGSNDTGDVAIQNLVGNAALFLGLLAVLYAIWGGFNILTAGWEEEKVKKGKTIIIQAAIGLVVIWLANSIVQWLLTKILWNG